MTEEKTQEEVNRELLREIWILLRGIEDFKPKYLFYANEGEGIFLPHDKTPAPDSAEYDQLRNLVREVRKETEAFLPLVGLQACYEEEKEIDLSMIITKMQIRGYYYANGWTFFYVWDENLPGVTWWDEESGEETTEDPGITGVICNLDEKLKTQWR